MFANLFLLWFPPFFICLWLAIMRIAAWSSGWGRLGRLYAAKAAPDGERFRFQSVGGGLSNYGGIVTIIIAADGLFLHMYRPFSFFHPDLLLPWSAIRVVKVQPSFFQRNALVEIGTPPLGTWQLPIKVIEAASEYLLTNIQGPEKAE